jgi:geranyl-CoA carboxylase alpha subunit
VDPALRDRLGSAAIAAALACGYRGAGTVEFLLGADGDFHFLEMNTRLQVEHPVTEAITGLDLVEWQIRVARGEALPAQSDLRFSGHAIEARLCAEDPAQGFLPQAGRVLRWAVPEGLRTDHALAEGLAVGTGYDSMLAKLIAHGPDRDTARRRLRAGLEALVLQGLVTNRALLAGVLDHAVFAAGEATTDFLDTVFSTDASLAPRAPAPRELALAAALFAHRAAPWDARLGWSNGTALPRRWRLESGGAVHAATVTLTRTPGGLRAETRGAAVELLEIAPDRLRVQHDGRIHAIPYAWDGPHLWLGDRALRDATHDPAAPHGAAAGDQVAAPMAGRLAALPVAEGQAVAAGQTVAVIEAMKMEHPLKAPRAGRVTGLTLRVGAQIAARQILMQISEAE